MIYGAIVLLSFVAAATGAASSSLPVGGLLFFETFDDADPFESGKWVKSSDSKYLDQPVLVKAANSPGKGFEQDKGIQLSQEMKFYGFGTKFPSPIDFKGKKELVIQYELKLEETLACGGAYIKLPRASADFDIAKINSDTPYSIMFGPDKCGTTNNKVHFILQHQNPLTSQWEEKHFNNTPSVKMDKKTHLYTLALREDNSFEIFIDKKPTKAGNLLTHMKPAINPPATIDDAEDLKPEDWVDAATMEDPSAFKPEEWDETAPKTIPNMDAVKPAAWVDDGALEIADPAAVKPVDWDDEEDGLWEAPLVPNPACEAAGCGEWVRPTMKNPAYKGIWQAPIIDNPAYIGVWKPRQVPNKDYFLDPTPALGLAPMAGLMVEVWTVSAGIHFDNFVIADSLAAAFTFADATYAPKHEMENKKEKKEKKASTKKERETKIQTGTLKEKMEASLAEIVEKAMEFFNEKPVAAIASLAALIITLVLLSVGLGGDSKKSKREAVSDRAIEADAVAEATDVNEDQEQEQDSPAPGSPTRTSTAAAAPRTPGPFTEDE